jgi:hypothetical protein
MKIKTRKKSEMKLRDVNLSIPIELLENATTIGGNIIPQGTIGYKLRVENEVRFIVIANHFLGAYLIPDDSVNVQLVKFPITLESVQ